MPLEPTVLRFGAFELDVRSRELRRGAARIRLQTQPFEILRMMLEHPGDVVTREELAQRLWPAGTFVDFEHSLNAAVKRLRAALGDAADRPRYVETVPRRGYRFIALSADQPDAEVQAERLRLAVLPFVTVGGDLSQEYFTDGLTDELIGQLGRVGRGRVGVIARWSSMVFKGSERRARDIGDTLRADYLLEGSVRRDNNVVRISASLVETASETQVWADTYERHLTDCLVVQADVAAQVVGSLAAELQFDAPTPRVCVSPNAAASQAYLKGKYHWNLHWTQDGTERLEEATNLFRVAVELDSSFAAASASLSRALIARAEIYDGHPRAALEEARRAAAHALRIDPSSSDAHLAIADIRRIRDWDWAGAEAAYVQAIALNPSSEAAHRRYALLLSTLNRREDAAAEAQRARELDPLCLVVATSEGWVHYLDGCYAEAAGHCRRALDLDPAFLPAQRVLGAALLQAGQVGEAMRALESAVGTRTGDLAATLLLAHAHAVAGDRASASRLLMRVQASAARFVSPYHVALVHTGLGNREAAFSALEEACEEKDPAVPDLVTDPRFEPLRRDRRYGRLMARLGLRAEDGLVRIPSEAREVRS
jgi:TolB-like protein/Tfp pilus assembly protein PilF